MKSQYRTLSAFVALLLAVGLACNGGNVSTGPASSGGVSTLDDVHTATIQIESQGTFVDPEVGLEVNAAGRGSGFIIDPSGIAVTNNHVVAGSALLKVWVGGETTPHNARVLGLSECSDLAVIDIEGDGFPFLNWYNGTVKVGMEVYSAGFPLGEPEFSLTKGIISKDAANGQTNWASLDHVLGHDATINPGNSGGPLVDAKGQVVGVNYSSRASANQYFAIGGDIATPVIEKLRSGKDVDSIGVNGTAILSDDGSLSGIWVSSVKSGSFADKAGVQGGDILNQLEGLVLATDGTMKDYCDVIRTHKPGDALAISVIRYATGEVLKGQLNGPELAVTGTFDTGGTSSTTSSGGTQSSGSGELTTFTDKNGLAVFDLPGDWTYENGSGDYYYYDTFTSPAGDAKIENLVYNDDKPFVANQNGKFALGLLHNIYSSTGKEGDIKVTDDAIQSDGSERLTWASKGGGYSGVSYFELRGGDKKTFLMFTAWWDNGVDQAVIDTINNVIASYRVP